MECHFRIQLSEGVYLLMGKINNIKLTNIFKVIFCRWVMVSEIPFRIAKEATRGPGL